MLPDKTLNAQSCPPASALVMVSPVQVLQVGRGPVFLAGQTALAHDTEVDLKNAVSLLILKKIIIKSSNRS